jgi:hypothetical protein
MKLKTTFLGLACLLATHAQDNLTYQTPPKAIADLVDAPSTPGVSVDANGVWMLLLKQSDLPSIAELAQPELRLAGPRLSLLGRAFGYPFHYLGRSGVYPAPSVVFAALVVVQHHNRVGRYAQSLGG